MSAATYWYVACLSKQLRSRPLARTILGQHLVLFRDESGKPAALLRGQAPTEVSEKRVTLLL